MVLGLSGYGFGLKDLRVLKLRHCEKVKKRGEWLV
jgi:hypothetical protein